MTDPHYLNFTMVPKKSMTGTLFDNSDLGPGLCPLGSYLQSILHGISSVILYKCCIVSDLQWARLQVWIQRELWVV